jgi:hypothetical protein
MKITFEGFDGIADAVDQTMLEMTRDAAREVLEPLTCDQHHEGVRKVLLRAAEGGSRLELSGCCEEFLGRANDALFEALHSEE